MAIQAIQARLIHVAADPSDPLKVTFAAEYVDAANPKEVLFTSPAWGVDANTPQDEIDAIVAAYGRDRAAVALTINALDGRTIEV